MSNTNMIDGHMDEPKGMSDEVKHIKEFIDNKDNFEQYKPKGNCETYQYDVLKYLIDKLKKYNVSHSDIAEIAVYLTYKAIVFSQDELRYYRRKSKPVQR